MNKFISIVGLFALILTAAPQAWAIAGGQTNASGRPGGGTCKNCHGNREYDGLRIIVGSPAAAPGVLPTEERECYARIAADGPFALVDRYYVATPSTRVFVTVAAPEPARGAQGAACALNSDCNLDGVADEVCSGGFCFDSDSLFCPVGDVNCAEPAVAGFDLEVTGAQGVSLQADPADPTTKEDTPPPGVNQLVTEVLHNQPKAFTGGQVAWNAILNLPPPAPPQNLAGQSITLYAAVNATNSNGVQDQGDLASLDDVDIYFFKEDGSDNGPDCETAPNCAAIIGSTGVDLNTLGCACPEGQIADFGNNECVPVGCTCTTTPNRAGGVAFAMLLGFGALLFRRRRS